MANACSLGVTKPISGAFLVMGVANRATGSLCFVVVVVLVVVVLVVVVVVVLNRGSQGPIFHPGPRISRTPSQIGG